MEHHKTAQEKFNQLRRQAEELIGEKKRFNAPAGFKDPLELIHELQTFQIELELQNDELHRSQQALMESKIRLTELYDFAPVGYITLSSKGLILNANLTFADMLSVERRHLLNQPLSAHIVFEDQDIYYRYLQDLSDSKTRQTCELRMRKKDSLPFHVRLESTIGSDDCQNPEQYRTAVLDITERAQAQEAFKKSEEKFRIMMESMNDPVYICSSDYVVEYMNPAMMKLIKKDATGETCFNALFGLNEKCPWCRHDEIKQNESFESEIVNPKNNRSYHITHSRMVNKNGSISKMSVYKDTTEYKQMEARLQQNKKLEAAGLLAGGIAHDFNNILSPIMGFAEMSLEDLPENHPIRENLEDILKGAKRARDLVKQILSFSSQKENVQEPLLLQPMIKEGLNFLRATIPSNIEIQQDLYNMSDRVLCNPTEIHEIVMNLCTNAYHAMENTGGTLSVCLKKAIPDPDLKLPDRPYCCLSVSDTGMGIPSEIMNNIFDPYFTTKELGKGSGLGLSVIHGIVQKHQGAITVDSKPGSGSVFNVYLPITSVTKKSDENPDDLPYIGGDERILFVDDEEVIVKLGLRLLERAGYTITGKVSSVEALALFKSAPDNFDLVITDMAMPKIVGAEFAKKLMEIRPDIPIIICSGFSEQIDKEKAESLGIRDFIHKPILTRELFSKIRQVLDQTKKE